MLEDRGEESPDGVGLESWLSTFLMLRPLNTVSHIVLSPNHNIIFIATSQL